VTVDGDDWLPDMLIGRLPVNSITETQVVVNKIVQYETAPPPGNWDLDVAFVADDADTAGDFAAISDVMASSYITAPFAAMKIYYTPPDYTATQQAVLGRWNAGAGLIVFNGHASESQWAAERLFHRDDVPGLVNGTKLPVAVQMTCLTGTFHNPSFGTLDETLLRATGGGSVAVWGPTGLGVATGHADLADGFLSAVMEDQQPILCFATLSGKLRLVAQGPLHLELLDTIGLLGDPATRLTFIP